MLISRRSSNQIQIKSKLWSRFRLQLPSQYRRIPIIGAIWPSLQLLLPVLKILPGDIRGVYSEEVATVPVWKLAQTAVWREVCRVLFNLHPPFSCKGLWIQQYVQTVSQANLNNCQYNLIGLNFQAHFQDCEKACISSVMSVSLSVRPHGSTRLPFDRFLCKFILDYIWKVCRENSSFIPIWCKEQVL
jgi:hypothetical protein